MLGWRFCCHLRGSGTLAEPGIEAQLKLALTGGQPLPRCSLQQLKLRVVVRRAKVLDIPRAMTRGMDDLHRLPNASAGTGG
jgi:hypothetical protein